MKSIAIIFTFIVLFIPNTFSQSNNQNIVDSLKLELNNTKHDTTRLNLLNSIARQYRYSLPDTAMFYFQKALDLSNKILDNSKGLQKLEQGKIDEITRIVLINRANSFRHIGIINENLGSYDVAMNFYLKSFDIYEKLSNLSDNKSKSAGKAGLSYCHNNLGLIFLSQSSYEKALEHFSIALKMFKEKDFKKGVAACYNNIGNMYYQQGYSAPNLQVEEELFNKAAQNYTHALLIAEEIDDKYGMSQGYNNMGAALYNMANTTESSKLKKKFFQETISYFLKAADIAEEIEDKYGIINNYGNISAIHTELSQHIYSSTAIRKAHLDTALIYGINAHNLAEEIKSFSAINRTSKKLLELYKEKGSFKKALQYAEMFIASKDSMFSEEKTRALAEITTKYETEKKQLVIEKMEKEKLADAKVIKAEREKSRKQKIIIILSIDSLLIVLGFSFIILRMFRQKKKDNQMLAFQNKEISQQKEEIMSQRDEIEAQRDLVMDQKDKIEKINDEITDSILYAKYIQNAILPQKEKRDKLLNEHFVFFKPKNIVSGDFYWTTEVEGKTIIAASDCTGHGVPGAFMSMLGVSFLNDIVNKEYITHPGVILRRLRKEVINALQQKGEQGEQRDGMDIALCSIDFNSMELQFSGANNPLYLVRAKDQYPIEGAKNIEYHDNVLYEIKGDKMPIALYEKMDRFQIHEIKLLKGDCLYMFTDGFADQFGGPKGKKFMYKPFKQLLLANCDKSMNEQKAVLDQTLTGWQQDYEQIDDILVVGIKI